MCQKISKLRAFPGYVYTAFHRQTCTCSPCAASWLGESQMQTGCKPHLDIQTLNWWALKRAAAWSHTSWFTLSSPLSGLSAYAPPKYPMHVASVNPLRVSPLFLADLTTSLLSKACHQATQIPHLCCLLMCQDASRMTRGTAFVTTSSQAPWGWPTIGGPRKNYNLVVPGQLQGWLQSLSGSVAFQQKDQQLCPRCQMFCHQVSFALIFYLKAE